MSSNNSDEKKKKKKMKKEIKKKKKKLKKEKKKTKKMGEKKELSMNIVIMNDEQQQQNDNNNNNNNEDSEKNNNCNNNNNNNNNKKKRKISNLLLLEEESENNKKKKEDSLLDDVQNDNNGKKKDNNNNNKEKKRRRHTDDDDSSSSSSSNDNNENNKISNNNKNQILNKNEKDNNNNNNNNNEKIVNNTTSKKKKKKREGHNSTEDDVDDNNKYNTKNNNNNDDDNNSTTDTTNNNDDNNDVNFVRPLVESSALLIDNNNNNKEITNDNNITLLLFYQYVEPIWDDIYYKQVAIKTVEKIGLQNNITGRMRVAKEGLNCTLTGTANDIRNFCYDLRKWNTVFNQTEFKLTHHLPNKQQFKSLKIIKVTELVHYGLDGEKAPPITNYSGIHLEPNEYHEKLGQSDTVVIDVRNHYEANIGRFHPGENGAEFLDPKMRKSTEFPIWLDSKETKEKLRNKQVLMYCTGGIRCERASALLQYKINTDPTVAELNIKGVYQLQGGIDKYFKNFPNGGYWIGKNYVFDKRFAHAPAKKESYNNQNNNDNLNNYNNNNNNNSNDNSNDNDQKPSATVAVSTKEKKQQQETPMGKCEACNKPWDMYRGKRRCPTCGVPSLICKDCYKADIDGIKKINRNVRCDLCVEQDIKSKKLLKLQEEQKIYEYEQKQIAKGLLHPAKIATNNGNKNTNDTVTTTKSNNNSNISNPDNITRLFLRNMCKKNMTEEVLMQYIPGITHIVWNIKRGQFLGQGWVEMESSIAAANAVTLNGKIKIFNRPLYIEYQKPNGKDLWPPPKSAVVTSNYLITTKQKK